MLAARHDDDDDDDDDDIDMCVFIRCISKVSKVDDCGRGRPEGSLFNSYYTEM